jgi:hypothetical protein
MDNVANSPDATAQTAAEGGAIGTSELTSRKKKSKFVHIRDDAQARLLATFDAFEETLWPPYVRVLAPN